MQAAGNERLKRIHEQVHQVKANQELGVRYMQEWEERIMIRNEGRQEGRQETQIEAVNNLMKKMTLDVEAACDIIGISLEDYMRMKDK